MSGTDIFESETQNEAIFPMKMLFASLSGLFYFVGHAKQTNLVCFLFLIDFHIYFSV